MRVVDIRARKELSDLPKSFAGAAFGVAHPLG